MPSSGEVLRISPNTPSREAVYEIVSVLEQGGLIAFPTDTVYGLGGLVTSGTKRRILALKKREAKKPIAVFVSSASQVKELASYIPRYAHALMREFWPGRLTLVFKSSHPAVKPLFFQGKAGIRIPNQPWLLSVLRELRRPLLQTSANISGQPVLTSARQVLETFGSRLELIVDAGKIGSTKPSTVLDVTGPLPIILREGAISRSKLEKVLKRKVYVPGKTI